MKPRRLLAQQDASEIFDHAVCENALAVLSLQQDNEWTTFKCRFLERDPDGKFFVLDYQPLADQVFPTLISGQYVGVSFRHRSRKILFASVVEARGRFMLDRIRSVSAVRYRWPDSITELQRRAYYRTLIPADTRVLANIWPGGQTARASVQESALLISTGQLLDVSCGGTLVRLEQISPPDWVENTTVGVELHLDDGQPPIMADACYRGARHDSSGRLCVALQLVGLELASDGDRVLNRLAKYVQKLHRRTIVNAPRGENPRYK
ncbi:MAG: hypothetical protein KKB50_05205 [Planctomycetes bacterium]|nr:hypothetical protein [Planctomycetota bacterium]